MTVPSPSAARAADSPAPGHGVPAAPGPASWPQPVIWVRATGERVPLRPEVTTVGRGTAADIRLAHASVSVLHAELVCRGPYVYVADLGLSANGTLVNGRPVTRRLLAGGDVLCFGAAAAVITGLPPGDPAGDEHLAGPAVPALTRREADVLAALCRPAQGHDAFTAPATPAEIAAALVITESAARQHLLRLYAKLRIPEGTSRRLRLANNAISTGLTAQTAGRHCLPRPGHATCAAPAQTRAAVLPGRDQS
jgi:FHA domain